MLQRHAHQLKLIAALGIAAVAVLRCLIAFAPHAHFDVDPAVDPNPLAGMAMSGSFSLDVLLLLLSAAGVLGMIGAGQAVRWSMFALALAPLPIVLFHGWDDLGDLWRGSTWLAGIIAAVVAAHLAADRQLRTLMLALLLAALAPMLVRSAAQMTYEHAETVAEYESIREQFLADRGWAPDSPAATIYERRLRQAQPTGWFPTTNVLASLMVAGAILCTGMAIGTIRARLASGWPGVLGLLAIGCAGAVLLSGSKGAILTLVAGLVLCALPLMMPGIGKALRRYAPFLLLAGIAAALLGIVARGVMLPEQFLGEKSLLFRWHYLVSAARLIVEQPLTGVGPDGFQAAYTQVRVPRNPEEVISAHSVFVDWLAMLGVLAVGWIVLAAAFVFKAGQAGGESLGDTSQQTEPTLPRSSIRASLIVGIAAVGMAAATELHVLDVLGLTIRVLGMAAFATLTAMLLVLLPRLSSSHVLWPLAVAASVLVIHSQIEMTLFLPGSVVWGLCVLGIAASPRMASTDGDRPSRSGLLLAAVLAAIACFVLVRGVLPAASLQRNMAVAAGMVYPLADQPQQQYEQRMRAGQQLVQAYHATPHDPSPLSAAVTQFEHAVQALDGAPRAAALNEALAAANALVANHAGQHAYSVRVAVHARRASMQGNDDAWLAAAHDARQVVEHDPHSNAAWATLGDLLWQAGDREQAAEAYARALVADDNFELDPLKQFAKRRRDGVEQRMNAAR